MSVPSSPCTPDAPGALTPDPRPARRRARIVVVDDDASVRALVCSTLGRDHDLVATATAEQALRSLEQGRAEALVLDLGLGPRDGLGLLREVKEQPMRYGRPVVVVLTGSQDEELRRRVERLGVEAWFPKPFDPGMLQATVELLVDALCCPPGVDPGPVDPDPADTALADTALADGADEQVHA